jgi:hypothetical protein
LFFRFGLIGISQPQARASAAFFIDELGAGGIEYKADQTAMSVATVIDASR